MLVLIDNYDSFTYNLYQILAKYDEIKVFRNDKITIGELDNLKPKGIVISPGPGRPENAGILIDIVREFKGKYKILGVCLGHQGIAQCFGAKIVRANKIVHGKKDKVFLKKVPLFEGISNEEEVMRYHSLIVERETLPDELEIIAETLDKEIMGVKHKEYEIYGIQFHPESIYTSCGERIIENFIKGVCQ